MKNKYYAIAIDPDISVIWSTDCMESAKRHAVEDVEITSKIYGWEALDDCTFSTPAACIVSGRRVVAAYYYRRGWQRENYTASAPLLEAIEKHITVYNSPETISAGNQAPEQAPETQEAPAAQVEPEKAPETQEALPEAIALAPDAFQNIIRKAPRCGLLLDIQQDAVRYKTQDGRPRCIYAYSITADGNAARIRYRNGGNRGQILLDKKHECYPVAAVVAGTVSAFDALFRIQAEVARTRELINKDRYYIMSTRKPSEQRKTEIKEKIQHVAVLADQAACIIKNSADGIPLFIELIAGELETVAAVASEIGMALSSGKRLEAVAAWIREIAAACMEALRETMEARRASVETVTERPETISAGNPAPEQAPETQEAPAGQVEPEKAPETVRKYAAYYADFPYTAHIFTARNRKEAETNARKYRRAWRLPALLRVEELTDEKAAPEAVAQVEPEKAPETVQEAPQAPAAQVEPEKAPETVILIEKTYDIRNGWQGTRRIVYNPEAGTTEAAQEAPQAAADVQPEPEARHRIQAPEKPACNPGKPLDFIGQVLSGNGWQIVFDANLQRTRVIIEKSAREKAAPLAESAGFYYSSNTDSWHKKLTHKAHRAAVALAEKLRAACA